MDRKGKKWEGIRENRKWKTKFKNMTVRKTVRMTGYNLKQLGILALNTKRNSRRKELEKKAKNKLWGTENEG